MPSPFGGTQVFLSCTLGNMEQAAPGTEPILCAPLLRAVDSNLVELLQALEPEEWELPTVAGSWRVRDVAAHLLDTCLRKLSLVRDGCFVEGTSILSSQDVVDLVNRLNREGVIVYRRLSPEVLVGLMQSACLQSAEFHESLDPFQPAVFNVSWAGEELSMNGFDTARELTERWHHQQQIRLATGRPGIMTRELYYPVLVCFLRGLPHLFRAMGSQPGTSVKVEIDGGCGGCWDLVRNESGWGFGGSHQPPAAHVVIPEEIAWRIFTKGIDRAAARDQVHISGDRMLGEKALDLTAIVG